MNKYLLIVIAVLITISTDCESVEVYNEVPFVLEKTDSTKLIQFKNNQAVVFTHDFTVNVSGLKNTRYYRFSELYVPDSAMIIEPTLNELTIFERELENHLQQTKKKAESLNWETAMEKDRLTLWVSQAQSVDSTGQFKQYWGYVEQNSDSILFGTFWSIDAKNNGPYIDRIIAEWKSFPIIINDGGPGYYKAKYNLSADTLIYIMVNGI